MEQKVTDIQIIPLRPQNGHVGLANFVYDNSFYFTSIGIYTRPQGGYRLTYPTRKSSSSSLAIFYPIHKEIASMIERAVISKFEEVTSTDL